MKSLSLIARRLSAGALSVCLVLCAACTVKQSPDVTTNQPARAPHARTVVLISIDGCRPDYLERGYTPTLSRLASEGARARALIPSVPTLTFPVHYTLVTGLHPDHHGVVGNTMTDPARPGAKFSLGNHEQVRDAFWWDGAQPIWVTAELHGVRTATMFWPGSEAAIRGVRPTHWRPYDKKFTYDQRVDQVLAWLDEPESTRPRFVTLYLEGVDTAGHSDGPDSPAVNEELRKADAAVARLCDGLSARAMLSATNLVIVSDHGMSELSEDRVIYLEDYADPDDYEVESWGAFTMLRPKPGREDAVVRALARAHPHMRCWRKQDFPARFAFGSHPRIAPVGCLADVGWQIRSRAHRPGDGPRKGTHGFDNAAPDMDGVLIACGPDVASGATLSDVWAVDVHALLGRMIGVPTPADDGEWSRVTPMWVP